MTYPEAMALVRELRTAGCDPSMFIIGNKNAVRCSGRTANCLTCPGRALLNHFPENRPNAR